MNAVLFTRPCLNLSRVEGVYKHLQKRREEKGNESGWIYLLFCCLYSLLFSFFLHFLSPLLFNFIMSLSHLIDVAITSSILIMFIIVIIIIISISTITIFRLRLCFFPSPAFEKKKNSEFSVSIHFFFSLHSSFSLFVTSQCLRHDRARHWPSLSYQCQDKIVGLLSPISKIDFQLHRLSLSLFLLSRVLCLCLCFRFLFFSFLLFVSVYSCFLFSLS